jgi:CheY-like chemotaxis protein
MTLEKRTTILIVEDDLIINNTYSEELRSEGFVVLSAENGKVGLDFALQEKPDIILLDILMPVMDGFTMMDKLRATNEYGKNVPIILLTDLSPDEDKVIQAIKKNEPEYFLVKSDWDISRVVVKLKERLMPHFEIDEKAL